MGTWDFQSGSIWLEKGFIPNKSTGITVTHKNARDIHLSESNLIVTTLGVFNVGGYCNQCLFKRK
ncbi:hypothetical protein MUB16_15825 [Priestia sp. OVL9]|nr:hypothetical protein [Priestia sp. OVL9]